MRNKFTSIYCSDSNTMALLKTNIPLQSKYKHFITEFNDSKFILNDRKGTIYYSEMKDNRIKGDLYYYTKMRFDLIKKPTFKQNKLYVNIPKYGWSNSLDNVIFLKEIAKNVKKFKTDGYITKGNGINKNIFELFNHYMYIKTLNWEDPRPRMFHECYYFNIPITYYNKYNIKDGSYQRYYELMENGLENRYLNNNDILIQNFLND